MKSIEERVEELASKGLFVPGGAVERMLKAALAELTIDLQAEKEKERMDGIASYISKLPANWFEDSSLETWFPLTAAALAKKEKEVAELREKLAAIEAGSDFQNLSVSSHFELDCGPINVEPALLDEVKRVLAIVDHPETEGCGCDACRFVRARTQLLTRLGGPHE